MKKYLLLIFFIFFQTMNLQSQNQFFPIKKASWEEANIGFSGMPFPSYLVLCGDTTISSLVYSKMYSLQLDGMGNETNRNYRGATRLDLDLVYFFESGTTEEYLLYDFSLETGESISLNTMFGPNTLTVGSNQLINTLDGVTRRVINFVNNNNEVIETWIEGIGSNLGVIDRGIDLTTVADFSPYMNCYKFEGNLGWKNQAIQPEPECNFTFDEMCETTSINPINFKQKINFDVFPNPFSENAVVEIQDFNQLKEPIFKIYNFQGQLVEKIEGIFEEKFNFSRKSLNAGVYVFELTDGKTTFATRKKIIIF